MKRKAPPLRRGRFFRWGKEGYGFELQGVGVPLRCAPGRAARAVGNDTTVANGAEPPPRRDNDTAVVPSLRVLGPAGAHPSRNGHCNGTRPTGPCGPSPPAPLPYLQSASHVRVPAMYGRGEISARDTLSVAPRSSPPLREERAGRGPGGGARGRSAMPVVEPRTVGHPNPSPEGGGGVDRRCEERAKRRSGERARPSLRDGRIVSHSPFRMSSIPIPPIPPTRLSPARSWSGGTRGRCCREFRRTGGAARRDAR
jgi:hypothetical protein